MDHQKRESRGQRRLRTFCRIMACVYMTLTMLYSFSPALEVYGAPRSSYSKGSSSFKSSSAPKSSTSSQAKNSYSSKANNYSARSSSYSSKSFGTTKNYSSDYRNNSSSYKATPSSSSSNKGSSYSTKPSSYSSKSSGSPSKTTFANPKPSGGFLKNIANRINNTVTAVANKAKTVAKTATSTITSKIPTPIKQAASRAYHKTTSTLRTAMGKFANASSGIADKTKNAVAKAYATIGQNIRQKTNHIANKTSAIIKTAYNAINHTKTTVNTVLNKTKTLISSSQQKIKTSITRYATHVRQNIDNAIQKGKQILSNTYQKTKNALGNAVRFITTNPMARPAAKGIIGGLQMVGGIAQTLGGVALSTTGLGAVFGIPMTAHGAADIVQGFKTLSNAFFGTKFQENNLMEDAYQWIGRKIGGTKGEAIAKKMFLAADIGFGAINAGKWIASVKHLKTLGTAADKLTYIKHLSRTKAATIGKTLLRGTIDLPGNILRYMKTVPGRALDVGKNITQRYGTDVIKKAGMVAGNIKGEYNILKQAFIEGTKTYNNLNKKAVVLSSNGAGELQKLYDRLVHAIKEYKNMKAKADVATAVEKVYAAKGAGTAAKAVTKFNDPYAGVKQASEYLKSQGVPRKFRKQILESFDVRTITMDVAGENAYGLRFHDFGVNAQAKGRYIFETFNPLTNRNNLALPPEWNSMTGIKQWRVKPGTEIIKGNAAPQFKYGSHLSFALFLKSVDFKPFAIKIKV